MLLIYSQINNNLTVILPPSVVLLRRSELSNMKEKKYHSFTMLFTFNYLLDDFFAIAESLKKLQEINDEIRRLRSLSYKESVDQVSPHFIFIRSVKCKYFKLEEIIPQFPC